MSLSLISFLIPSPSVFDITTAQITEYLNYFRSTYYPHASILQHMEYLEDLHTFFTQNRRLPTDYEFFIQYKRECLCPYTVSNDEFVRACLFFMRHTGTIGRMLCAHFYFHAQYYLIEHRDPSSHEEFTAFLRRAIMAETDDPNVDILNEPVIRPVEDTKLEQIRRDICTLDGQTCGICQEDIHLQNGVVLDCGHSFHAENKDCCETGTIFTWFESKRACPICRKEII